VRVMDARTAWSQRIAGLGPRGAAVGVLFGLASAVSACGSRTGLELDDVRTPTEPDSSTPPVPPLDAAPDVAIPISPVQTPPACVALPSPSAYVVTTADNLWQFNPSATTSAAMLQLVGHLDCPLATGLGLGVCQDPDNPNALIAASPFSMAVDRTGTAYVVYCDGEVFVVDTQGVTCKATGLDVPGAYGGAFTEDTTDANETFFVATGDMQDTLASFNTTTLAINTIGAFSPAAMYAELTGTGAGDLFAFYLNNGSEMSIAKVDKANAELTNILPLPGLPRGRGWAFVFWGGDFYTFTGAVSGTGATQMMFDATVITRISPADGSQTFVANMNELVVGAGVSTCAPQR
jgi:hypothetical protein